MRRAVSRNFIIGVIVVALLSIGAYAFSQEVSPERHPNLAAAQGFIHDAIDKITEAQKANKYDMKGHAARAKELLEEASHEIWLAAQAANANQ